MYCVCDFVGVYDGVVFVVCFLCDVVYCVMCGCDCVFVFWNVCKGMLF